MADASEIPDDPVAKAKAIAAKLAAQTTAPAEDAVDPAALSAAPDNGTALPPGPGSAAEATDEASELGKRKNRWGADPTPAAALPDAAAALPPGLSEALMAQAAEPATKRKKLFVPVKEHPDFNFMGILIGPRGSSLKDMQERSGAKILIRGKGSSKDARPDDPDQNEDLHVIIEGTQQAVDKASAEVEAIFQNPQHAQSLKDTQLKNLSSFNGDGAAAGGMFGGGVTSQYGPGGGMGGGGEETTLTMQVPNSMVGLVIGRGGENVQGMQRDYNVSVQITKTQDVDPNSETRPVILKGSAQSVQLAKGHIEQIVADRERQLAGGGGHWWWGWRRVW